MPAGRNPAAMIGADPRSRATGADAARPAWLAWGVAALAFAPVALVYVLHFLCAPAGLSGTGFLQGDEPSYMAEARANGLSLTYGLPFSADPATPRLYFQPIALVLGLLMRATRWDPGYVYVGYAVVAGVLMFRAAISLAELYAGGPRTLAWWLACVVLLWGGGVLVLTGWAFYALTAPRFVVGELWGAGFTFDPGLGSWFLNLGRNAYYATESLYHLLFFSTVLLVLTRRWGAAVVVLALTSASHPFTGAQLGLVVLAFAVVEQVTRRAEAPPLWFTAAAAAVLAAHLGYYLVLLPALSPEHRIVARQNSLPWVLPGDAILPAYAPMFALAMLRVLRRPSLAAALAQPRVRMALVWFAVSFVLANHELLVAPRQPIHFTRGYIWTPLALLALPVIEQGFAWLLALRPRLVAALLCAALLGFAVADNGFFFLRRYAFTLAHREGPGFLLRADERAVFARLSEPDMRGRLLLADDETLGYLATAYTPLRVWMAHDLNTPDSALRKAELARFFADGREPAAWRTRALVVVVDAAGDAAAAGRLVAAGFAPIGVIGRYRLFLRDPAA